MTQSAPGAPLGGGGGSLTPGGSGGGTGAGPSAGSGGGTFAGFGPVGEIIEKVTPKPEPVTIEPIKKTAYPLGAFKPRARLTLAKGKVRVPRGSRIAGRVAEAEIDLDRLLATDVEKLSFAWMCETEIPFDFETVLLGGRVSLNFVEVPFFLAEKLLHSEYQAIRIFEQMNAKMRLERDFLSNSGYEVIDLSGCAILNDVNTLMREVLELI